MAFDPCREWLGLDVTDLADPRRVLGLRAGVSSADAIDHAAAVRLESLRLISPGPFTKAHAALVARVEEARGRLLAGAGASAASPTPPSMPTALEGWSPSAPRRRRRSSGTGPLVAVIASLAAAAAGLAFFVLRDGRQVALDDRQPSGQVATTSETAAEPAAAAAATEARRTVAAEQRREAEAQQRVAAEVEKARVAAEAERRRQAAAAERQAQTERERDQAERRRTEDERRRRRATVDKALGDAYRALQRQEFDTAMRALAAAGDQVGDDAEAATRVEGWRLFATYAQEFPAYQERAFAAANAGREFEVEGVVCSVIEITPEKFVYKREGRTERVAREAVDPRIAMAVVKAWFEGDGRAANHLFLGARWLSLDPPDRERAEAEWRVAQAGGETAAPLLALLDDPAIPRPDR